MHFQDLGRYGWTHLGVSQGGAIDLHAHCWANYLLGNKTDAVTLEISLGSVSWQVLTDGEISLTGADMDAQLDGVKLSNWSTHQVNRGQVLSLGYARRGCHCYLGVKGGLMVEKLLGSGSTVVRNDMGGWLKEGEVISIKQNLTSEFTVKCTPSDFIPDYNQVRVVRVLRPDNLEQDFCNAFLSNTYKVSPASDRMGSRLESAGVLPALDGILSEGVSLGCIQLPPSGQPIVLLSDRQTQGGYAKVGNIVRVDLPSFVQMRPGTEFRFVPVSYEIATQEWREFVEFFGF